MSGSPLPTITTEDLFSRGLIKNQALEKFWGRWSTEYLHNLPVGRDPDAKEEVIRGTVVVISEDKTPRLSWPVSVVTELFPGKDGRVRTVKVKTSKGSLKDPSSACMIWK